MTNFIFDSTGGCAICDDMDIEHEEYPVRPHPFCDCTISPASATTNTCFIAEISWNVELDVKIKGDKTTVDFDLTYDITVNCVGSEKSGFTVYDESHTISMDTEDFHGKDQLKKDIALTWMSDAIDKAKELGLETCDCDKEVPGDMPVG